MGPSMTHQGWGSKRKRLTRRHLQVRSAMASGPFQRAPVATTCVTAHPNPPNAEIPANPTQASIASILPCAATVAPGATMKSNRYAQTRQRTPPPCRRRRSRRKLGARLQYWWPSCVLSLPEHLVGWANRNPRHQRRAGGLITAPPRGPRLRYRPCQVRWQAQRPRPRPVAAPNRCTTGLSARGAAGR